VGPVGELRSRPRESNSSPLPPASRLGKETRPCRYSNSWLFEPGVKRSPKTFAADPSRLSVGTPRALSKPLSSTLIVYAPTHVEFASVI